MKIFGLSENQVYVDKHIPDDYWGITPRKIMQVIGTELFRHELPKHFPTIQSIWVQTMERKIKSLPSSAKIVIDDVRFPDEIDLVHKLGGEVIRIISESKVRSTSG